MTSSTIDILGVDPSQRHTGLALLRGSDKDFYEIKTGTEDVLTSAKTVRREFREFVESHSCNRVALCVERQLVLGRQTSSLMFHMQMNLLQVIEEIWHHPRQFVMPLPNQLQSYIFHRHGLKPGKAASPVVNLYKKLTGDQRRVSIHCVDAYFLGQLGREVLKGTWEYNLPRKEPPQVPWSIANGK